MKKRVGIFLAFALFTSIGTASQQQESHATPVTQEAFHQEVVNLYNFHPRDLKTKEDENAKLEGLDAFFKKVEAKKEMYLPLLRAELAREDNSGYFYMDGSTLLGALSEERRDSELLLRGYARADLVGLGGTMYTEVVHHYAVKGLDTTAAALHILTYPEFKAYIDEHAMTLDLGMALIFMLYPMEEGTFLPAVIQSLGAQAEEKTMKALLVVLEVAATPEADAALLRFSQDTTKPESARAFAKESLDLAKAPEAPSGGGSEKKLRKQRREAMSRISDEALGEFMDITKKLRAKG